MKLVYYDGEVCKHCGNEKPKCPVCKQPLPHGFVAGTFLPCPKCFKEAKG